MRYGYPDMDIQYMKAGLRRGEPVFAICLRVVRFRGCWFVPVLFLIGFGNLNLTLRFGAIQYLVYGLDGSVIFAHESHPGAPPE